MSETFLCLKQDQKKISLAVYYLDSGRMDLSDILMCSLSASLVSQLTFLYSPAVVIAPSSSSETLKEVLSEVNVLYVPKSDFLFDHCKELIIEKCYDGDEFLAVTSINFQSISQIACCGALLKFLLSSGLKVHMIKYSNSCGMMVDFSTLQSLQIIKEDSHPSMINNIGRAKEGLSILSLIDNAVTPQGKRKIKEFLLRPMSNIEDINNRLNIVQYFLQNSYIVYDVISELKTFADLDVTLKKFKEAKTGVCDWEKILNSLKSFLNISKKLRYLADPPLIVKALCSINTEEIFNICKLLESCLVLNGDKLHIQSGVNSDLDYLVKIYQELDDFLINLAKIEKNEISEVNCHSLFALFIQGIGYVIEISFKNTRFPETFSAKNYSFQFATDDCLYFKTPRTAALDEKFGDLQGKIRDCENSIILKLENEILAISSSISLISQTIAELDALFSLTLFSETYKLSKPLLAPIGKIQIVNGRHLLVEVCVDNYIPNDCALDQTHRIAIITGPNYSGKSVYMKMIGIIVYLAHVGSFVPAEIAEIGLCDQIFSRIHTSESRYSSSFSEEISQVSIALQNCTEKSLLLFDEFGKGTCTVDGMCLFAGLIEEISRNRITNAILTTHYQELLMYNYILETENVKFYTMEMAGNEEAVFLYKLIRGMPSGSYGIWCAKWAGINEDVLNRAKAVKRYLRGEEQAEIQWEDEEIVKKVLKAVGDTEDVSEILRLIQELLCK